MSRSIAQLTPELRATIVSAARVGKSGREIHELIEGAINLSYIYVVISDERRRDATIPSMQGHKRTHGGAQPVDRFEVVCRVERSVLRELVKAAKARDISVQILGTRILTAIVDDRIIDAVLDDDVSTASIPQNVSPPTSPG